MVIAIAWIIFASVVIGLLLLNFFIVKYYNDKNESELFPTSVAILALTITLLCVFLIPVDIYSVSTQQGEDVRESIRILYLVMYCCVLSFAFCVIPFACFYYEAYDPESNSFLKRVWDGFKYTIALIVIVIILLVVGLFLRSPNDFSGTDPPDVWAKKFLGVGKGTVTITFAIACITIIGYVVWCTYTAYGLASLPIVLMKGRKSINQETKDITQRINDNKREREGIIDNSKASLLDGQERALNKRVERLKTTRGGCYKLFALCRPFSVIFGILSMLVSLLLVVSLGLTALDRVMNHIGCGVACGFILEHPSIFNPLDRVLILLANVFPVDYVLISLIVLYIYYATLHAVTEIGIRFFCLNMFSFRKGRTEPQALMTSSIILMLATLALNNAIVTLAPTYASYGSQTYTLANSTDIQECSIRAPANSSCIMTEVSNIVHGVDINIGFFGAIFFGFTWLFVLAFVISIIVAAVRAKKSNVEEYSDDEEEEENW